MALKLAPSDLSDAFVLDYKAFHFVLGALDHRIDTWKEACKAEDISEDDLSDLQNDIMYLGSIRSELERRFPKSYSTT